MSKEDLIPVNKRTKNEQKKITTAGGIASGKARREKKLIRETLETVLKLTLQKGDYVDIDAIQSIAETNHQNITVQDAIVLSMVKKALKGDVKAAEYIRDTAGQKPTDVVSILEPPVIVDDISR